MRAPLAVLATVAMGVVVLTGGALAQRATDAAAQHDHPATTASTPTPAMPQARAGMHDMSEMMARMHANDARLEQLVRKVQSATGTAKTDAVTELLTALVEDRKNGCEPMMAQMMSTMNPPAAPGAAPKTPATPSK